MFRLFIVLVSCYTVMCLGDDGVAGHDSESANCKPEEEYKWIYPCPGENTCRSRDDRILCPAVVQYQEPKCVCKEGLFRAEDGSCYNNEQCDKWKCPGDNEHFECGDECDNVCATLDKQNKTNCPTTSYVCKPKCYCNDGYARDDKGICVLIENCGPVSDTTESNE